MVRRTFKNSPGSTGKTIDRLVPRVACPCSPRSVAAPVRVEPDADQPDVGFVVGVCGVGDVAVAAVAGVVQPAAAVHGLHQPPRPGAAREHPPGVAPVGLTLGSAHQVFLSSRLIDIFFSTSTSIRKRKSSQDEDSLPLSDRCENDVPSFTGFPSPKNESLFGTTHWPAPTVVLVTVLPSFFFFLNKFCPQFPALGRRVSRPIRSVRRTAAVQPTDRRSDDGWTERAYRKVALSSKLCYKVL